ncbi:acyl-CoA thioesterase [Rhodophyticola porphyridii]|uniref:acyl-CoA thioesterase n=1 Tax=Rhodophyticola porphyridii TaxID=1852017 RepID=UPI001B0DEEE0|nr:acyl-CoA thioesterase [Roseicyclus sp.]MBO6623697.1 acyl-CoA thioesterase [Roseicyclus sp.]MBO6922850.1 acyl-CoA thioesterase [Roseicyclus sp.]
MAFSMRQKVLFKHCDPAGIVFYPRYFEMMNDCVEAFFDHIGHPFEELHAKAAVPTAQIETTFTAPSHHGDMLDIRLGCTRIGTSSLGIAWHASADGETRFTASATLVHVGQDGRPLPWPAPLRDTLELHLEGAD